MRLQPAVRHPRSRSQHANTSDHVEPPRSSAKASKGLEALAAKANYKPASGLEQPTPSSSSVPKETSQRPRRGSLTGRASEHISDAPRGERTDAQAAKQASQEVPSIRTAAPGSSRCTAGSHDQASEPRPGKPWAAGRAEPIQHDELGSSRVTVAQPKESMKEPASAGKNRKPTAEGRTSNDSNNRHQGRNVQRARGEGQGHSSREETHEPAPSDAQLTAHSSGREPEKASDLSVSRHQGSRLKPAASEELEPEARTNEGQTEGTRNGAPTVEKQLIVESSRVSRQSKPGEAGSQSKDAHATRSRPKEAKVGDAAPSRPASKAPVSPRDQPTPGEGRASGAAAQISAAPNEASPAAQQPSRRPISSRAASAANVPSTAADADRKRADQPSDCSSDSRPCSQAQSHPKQTTIACKCKPSCGQLPCQVHPHPLPLLLHPHSPPAHHPVLQDNLQLSAPAYQPPSRLQLLQQCPTLLNPKRPLRPLLAGLPGLLLTGCPLHLPKLPLQLLSQVLHQLQVPVLAAYQAPLLDAYPGQMRQPRSLASHWQAGSLAPMHHRLAAALRLAWLTGSRDQMLQLKLLQQVSCSLMPAAMVQAVKVPISAQPKRESRQNGDVQVPSAPSDEARPHAGALKPSGPGPGQSSW